MMEERIKVAVPSDIKIKKASFKIFVVLFLAVILILTYLPILVMGLTSFSTHPSGYDMPGVTTKWYGMLFTNRELFNSIMFTLRITFLSTIISTIFGTFSAIGINALNRKWRRRAIMFNNVPILNADIVTAALLLVMFQSVSMIITSILPGNKTFNFIARYGEAATLIAHVLFSTPYVILSVLPKLSKDESLFEAALDLGCSPNQALFKVVVPNLSSGIFSGALLAFTMSIDDFIITYFVSGSNQNFSTWLYGNLKTMKNGQWNQACAYNTILMLVTFTGIIAYQLFTGNKKSKKVVK